MLTFETLEEARELLVKQNDHLAGILVCPRDESHLMELVHSRNGKIARIGPAKWVKLKHEAGQDGRMMDLTKENPFSGLFGVPVFFKGDKGAECERSACRFWNAVYQHRITGHFYCQRCATEISQQCLMAGVAPPF